ncbi:hypothetical protein [Limobrevibacterium gyesilva]|uniref:Uncharacterized protein n=1 Tax=Limobrevibacterium gyesilva TaxID=2991712 RepID=A0AA41YK26_9PROT|nr:hypothetical protein [Limobrevibacterium gyesilva]MCW3474030.1 hypothetical protein [Limobrevibacterium gyesilva]
MMRLRDKVAIVTGGSSGIRADMPFLDTIVEAADAIGCLTGLEPF